MRVNNYIRLGTLVFGTIFSLALSLYFIFIDRPEVAIIPSLWFIFLGIFTIFYIRFNRLSIKDNLPIEDEYTRKIDIYSSKNAFKLSFILWVVVLVISMMANFNLPITVTIGLTGMAMAYLSFWTYYNIKGV